MCTVSGGREVSMQFVYRVSWMARCAQGTRFHIPDLTWRGVWTKKENAWSLSAGCGSHLWDVDMLSSSQVFVGRGTGLADMTSSMHGHAFCSLLGLSIWVGACWAAQMKFIAFEAG